MNAKGTSGTFSTASLLYYHLTRYLDASIRAPVSVYRSIDRKAHEQRVTRRGLDLSAGKKSLAMNHAAWQELDQVEKNPDAYAETDELFTADRIRIYGVLLHVHGKRYGPELNGTRKSGWGEGQNRDFQETAPFLALRSEKPLEEAIAEGLAKAERDRRSKKAMKGGVSKEQMAYWMQDLTEITLSTTSSASRTASGTSTSCPTGTGSRTARCAARRRTATTRRPRPPARARSSSAGPGSTTTTPAAR